MSATVEKLLALARGEIGVKEKPPGGDKVKYNDAMGWGNNAWCCTFLWWLFREAGASELFFGGGKTAYCPALLSYHRGQAVKGDYRPGDVIFFNFSGKNSAAHVGLCESWTGTYVTTIDGNTGTGSEANGGAVMRRRRHKKYIVGAYRPQYKEEDMAQEQFNNMFVEAMRQYRQELRDNDCGGWSQEARQFAVDQGIFSGGTPGQTVSPTTCGRTADEGTGGPAVLFLCKAVWIGMTITIGGKKTRAAKKSRRVKQQADYSKQMITDIRGLLWVGQWAGCCWPPAASAQGTPGPCRG